MECDGVPNASTRYGDTNRRWLSWDQMHLHIKFQGGNKLDARVGLRLPWVFKSKNNTPWVLEIFLVSLIKRKKFRQVTKIFEERKEYSRDSVCVCVRVRVRVCVSPCKPLHLLGKQLFLSKTEWLKIDSLYLEKMTLSRRKNFLPKSIAGSYNSWQEKTNPTTGSERHIFFLTRFWYLSKKANENHEVSV